MIVDRYLRVQVQIRWRQGFQVKYCVIVTNMHGRIGKHAVFANREGAAGIDKAFGTICSCARADAGYAITPHTQGPLTFAPGPKGDMFVGISKMYVQMRQRRKVDLYPKDPIWRLSAGEMNPQLGEQI